MDSLSTQGGYYNGGYYQQPAYRVVNTQPYYYSQPRVSINLGLGNYSRYNRGFNRGYYRPAYRRANNIRRNYRRYNHRRRH